MPFYLLARLAANFLPRATVGQVRSRKGIDGMGGGGGLKCGGEKRTERKIKLLTLKALQKKRGGKKKKKKKPNEAFQFPGLQNIYGTVFCRNVVGGRREYARTCRYI